MFPSLTFAFEKIFYSYLIFALVFSITMLAGHFLIRGPVKQTKTVEALMTFGTFFVLFGIPFITISFSRTQSIALIIIFPLLIVGLAVFIHNKKIEKAEA